MDEIFSFSRGTSPSDSHPEGRTDGLTCLHWNLGRKHGFESDRYAVPCHAPATPPPSFTEYRLRNENLFPSLTSFPLSSLLLSQISISLSVIRRGRWQGWQLRQAREMKGRSFSSPNILSLARLSKESSIDHFLSIPFTCAINQLRINEPAGSLGWLLLQSAVRSFPILPPHPLLSRSLLTFLNMP